MMMPEGVPSHAEMHSASNYNRREQRQSKYLPDKTYTVDLGLFCPRCSAHTDIDHGRRVTCRCNLTMEQWGNALFIWADKPLNPIVVKADPMPNKLEVVDTPG